MPGRSCGRSTTATSASPTTPGVGSRPARTATKHRVDVSSAHVTAVLVTLDAARWLPSTLEALEHLQDRPHRLIAIDNASSDITLTLLEHARDQGVIDAVYSGKRTLRLRHRGQVRSPSGPAEPRPGPDHLRLHAVSADDSHWLWLLHDDAVPAPDALHQTARPRDHRPVHRHHRTQAACCPSAGTAASRSVRSGSASPAPAAANSPSTRARSTRASAISRRSRLGVSTCGMLVRTAVWRDLDGLDPALPVFRDGVEFGWRAHLNGYRVVTTPEALVIHRQVGRAGLRPRGLTGRRPGKVDRLLGMIVVAGHAPGKMLPLVWLRLVFSCLTHAVAYLLGKVPRTRARRDPGPRLLRRAPRPDPGSAHPDGGDRSRSRNRRGRRARSGRRGGTACGSPPRRSSGAASERYRSVAGDVDAASLDEMTGDDFSSVADERPRHAWLSPIVITTVGGDRGQPDRRPRAVRPRLPRRAGPAARAREAVRSVACRRRADSRGAGPDHARPGWGWSRSARRCWPGSRSGSAPAAVRRGAARAADRVPGGPPADQRPPAAALGRRHVRAASGAAWAGPIRAGSP